jgi:Tol biopolymer transport system component
MAATNQPSDFPGRQDAGVDFATRWKITSLYAMDLASGQEQRLADGATEPSFSPNGKYIMYANKGGGRASLAVVSVDGRVKQRCRPRRETSRSPAGARL